MVKQLNVLSTFSGAGGMDIPFHADPRFNVVAHCEINKHCDAVLRYNFSTPNLGDINKLDIEALDDLDMVIGGFPCQNISIQGKQEGLAGNKSGLFFRLMDIVEAKKPKFVLLENVKNLLSINKGADFEIINGIFEELGYKLYSRLFDSSEYGTSQQRVRVFMFAVRNEINGFGESNPLDAVEGTQNGKGKTPAIIAWSKSTRANHVDFRIRQDGLINTLTTGKGCRGASTGNMVIYDNTVRELSPNECEYLQGWPMSWTEAGHYIEDDKLVTKTIPKAQRYKMCGNGVHTGVVEAIKNEIFGSAIDPVIIKCEA